MNAVGRAPRAPGRAGPGPPAPARPRVFRRNGVMSPVFPASSLSPLRTGPVGGLEGRRRPRGRGVQVSESLSGVPDQGPGHSWPPRPGRGERRSLRGNQRAFRSSKCPWKARGNATRAQPPNKEHVHARCQVRKTNSRRPFALGSESLKIASARGGYSLSL